MRPCKLCVDDYGKCLSRMRLQPLRDNEAREHRPKQSTARACHLDFDRFTTKQSLDPTIQLCLYGKHPRRSTLLVLEKYPGLSENELKDVKEFLESYAELALRIFERISKDPAAYAKFKAKLKEIKSRKNWAYRARVRFSLDLLLFPARRARNKAIKKS